MLLLVFAVELLKVVGFDLESVLTDERMMVPVALAAGATAVGTARARTAVLETFRGLALALLRILLPVHLALVLVLLGAAGLWGLDALDTGSSAAAMLLIAAGLAVAIRSAFVRPRAAIDGRDRTQALGALRDDMPDRVSDIAPDLAYLAFESGAHGRAAIAALEASARAHEPALAARLEALRGASDRWEFERAESVLERTDDRAAAVRAGTLDVVVRAAGTTRTAGPDEFGAELFQEATDAWMDSGAGKRLCLAAGARCMVLTSDESPLPGARRLVVFAAREGPERVLVGWAGGEGEKGEIRRLVPVTGVDDEPEPFDAPATEIDALFDRMAAGELPLVPREILVLALGDAVAVPGRA